MGKTLLKRLYNGEIYPSENIYLDKPKDKARKNKIFTEDEHFEELLSPEDFKRLEKLEDLRHDEMSDYLYANFLHGFRLGMGFAVEAFTNEDVRELNS